MLTSDYHYEHPILPRVGDARLPMRVLVACEFSGIVRDAFAALGHDAWSCDLLPCERGGNHICADVRTLLEKVGWDLMIAHPPCTYLTCTGNKWFKPEFASRFPNREKQREDAAAFFMELINAPVPRIAIENPIGVMSSRYRKPDQVIQPHQFGDSARKATCLWLEGLPPLLGFHAAPVKLLHCKSGRTMDYNYAYSRGKNRAASRSRTFQGIANAMAAQWGTPHHASS